MAEEKKPKTDIFNDFSEEKKPKLLYAVIALLLVVVIVLAVSLFKGKKEADQLSPQVKQMQATVQKIQSLETDIQTKQNEVFSLLKEYQTKTGQSLAEINVLNLTPEQKTILEEKIKNEQNVSIKSLLQEILNRNNEISELKGKVSELEALLPKPHVVEKGENHFEIAMKFLTEEKGIEKSKAMELVERTALFESLVPGFKVWNFYADDEFGTFVTQGTAPVSPNQVQRRIKKALVDARDKAIAEKEQLNQEVAALENRKTELINQLDTLNQEKESLLSKLSELDRENTIMQTKLNSLFFILDLKDNLEKRGILKGGFLRSTKLQSVNADEFKLSIDLRQEDTVNIDAAAFNIEKIKSITVYPNFYQEGKEYSVSIAEDKKSASVKILDISKLKNERIVIAIN